MLPPIPQQHDAHLWGNLSYPRDVKGEFLKQFQELVDRFEKYTD